WSAQRWLCYRVDLPTMLRKAFNTDLIDAGRARFHLASVEQMPLAHCSFDRALTINTIYFWPDPVRAEVARAKILDPSGAGWRYLNQRLVNTESINVCLLRVWVEIQIA